MSEDDTTPLEKPLGPAERRAFETLRKIRLELETLGGIIDKTTHDLTSGQPWSQRTAQDIEIQIRHGIRQTMSALERLYG